MTRDDIEDRWWEDTGLRRPTREDACGAAVPFLTGPVGYGKTELYCNLPMGHSGHHWHEWEDTVCVETSYAAMVTGLTLPFSARNEAFKEALGDVDYDQPTLAAVYDVFRAGWKSGRNILMEHCVCDAGSRAEQ